MLKIENHLNNEFSTLSLISGTIDTDFYFFSFDLTVVR